jgi:hypothetical protein
MKARTDEFVRYSYIVESGRNATEFCTGIPGWAVPCPTSGASTVVPPCTALLIILAVMNLYR